MSRIGKLPIPIPAEVKVNLEDRVLKVSGPKGTLGHIIRPGITVEITEGNILVKPTDNNRKTRALYGLTRSLIANLITGVTKGFERILDISGVGYRAEVNNNTLTLTLGYSHPINFDIPSNIAVTVDKQNRIIVEGCDKQKVGEVAAKIRAFRPVEPYKAKGIRFVEEKVRRKVGKTGAK
ncbi:MAG: 50S ribosomal protein L6 [Desulfobacterota bacterium]|nr:50S ribosomal protein L6 [Thermodesulfobacteriota bacterium]